MLLRLIGSTAAETLAAGKHVGRY